MCEPMNERIRDVEPADIPALVRLCAEHAAYERCDYDPSGKAEMLSEHLFSRCPALFCLIVENERGEAAGYATFSREFSTWSASYFLHLDCLYLRPESRNRGLGRSLIRTVSRRALELGCRQIQWQTPNFNEGAIRFYRRLGAKEKAKLRFFLDEPAMKALTTNIPEKTR
jgi:GNAT superfamily N-acetyltransferase